jgi:hypothetical protein
MPHAVTLASAIQRVTRKELQKCRLFSHVEYCDMHFVCGFFDGNARAAMNVGPCHHGKARPQVADGGTASDMEGSCE